MMDWRVDASSLSIFRLQILLFFFSLSNHWVFYPDTISGPDELSTHGF